MTNPETTEVDFQNQVTTLANQLNFYRGYFEATQSKTGKEGTKTLRKRGQLFMQEVHFLTVTSLTAVEEIEHLRSKVTELLANTEKVENQLHNAMLDRDLAEDRAHQYKAFNDDLWKYVDEHAIEIPEKHWEIKPDLEVTDLPAPVVLSFRETLAAKIAEAVQAKTGAKMPLQGRILQTLEQAKAKHPAGKGLVEAAKAEIRTTYPNMNDRVVQRLAEAKVKAFLDGQPGAFPRPEEQPLSRVTGNSFHTATTVNLQRGDKANQRLAEAMNQFPQDKKLWLFTINRHGNEESRGLHLVAETTLGYTNRTIGLWPIKEAVEAGEFFANFRAHDGSTDYPDFSWLPRSLRLYAREQVLPREWREQDTAWLDNMIQVSTAITPDYAVWPGVSNEPTEI
jgi:hypothetical protein